MTDLHAPTGQVRIAGRVRFAETDPAGIVYYPSFFTWFVLGTDALLRKVDGRITDDEGRPRWTLPIAESSAKFLAPLKYDDLYEIRSHVAHRGERSFRVEHAVYHGETLCASGYEVRVYVETVDGRLRSAPLPAELLAALAVPDDV